jgi:hypothetical protein
MQVDLGVDGQRSVDAGSDGMKLSYQWVDTMLPGGRLNRSNAVPLQKLNRICSLVLIALSLIALLTVLSGYLQPPQPPEPDEGTAAHIFQLSIAAYGLLLLLFLASADWSQPLRSARPLLFSATTLVVALGALYYLEQYRYIAPPR